MDRRRDGGNAVFVSEHDRGLVRRAQWLVDVGPEAGEHGGRVLYSGEPEGLRQVADSRTARYLFDQVPAPASRQRSAESWLELQDIHRHNLKGVDAQVPLGLLTAVTGISGSGKSSLMAQALPELMLLHLGHEPVEDTAETAPTGQAYVVQLGALKNAAKVNEIVAQLRLSGYRAFTVPATPVAGQITRIYVGPDASKAKMQAAVGELQGISGLGGVVKPWGAR